LNTIFQQLYGTVAASSLPHSVTQKQYTAWQKQYTFEALKGAQYGASFCKHFEIQDYRIYFESSPESCDYIIQKEWLV
jgi:hypothetical protein